MGKYEEVIRGLPAEPLPGPLDAITRRLDFIGPKTEEVLGQVDKLKYDLAKLSVGEGVAMPTKIEQIPFPYALTAAGTPTSGAMLTENAPFPGYIKQVSIHWPAGCNALVDVRVGHGVKQFCPDEGFLALDGFTPTYPFSEWVDDHEEIWVEMRNGSAFPHTITVTVILEGVAE